jgi:hypothetical protein
MPLDSKAAFAWLSKKLGNQIAISLMSSMGTQYAFWEVQLQRNRTRAFREKVELARAALDDAEKLAEKIEPLSPSMAIRAAHHVAQRERDAGWNSPKEKYEKQFLDPVRARRALLDSSRIAIQRLKEMTASPLLQFEAGQSDGPDFVLTFPSGGKRTANEILCIAAAIGARHWIARNSAEVAQTVTAKKGRGPTRVTATDVAYAAVALGIEKSLSRQRWAQRLARSTKVSKRHPLLALQRGKTKPSGRMTIRHQTPLVKRAREILEAAGPNADAEAFELLMGFVPWFDVWPIFLHLKQLRESAEVLR